MKSSEVCRLEEIHKIYPMGDLEVQALAGVSTSLYSGEFTVFAGPSGSGKSTLLNLIGLLDSPTKGSIWLQQQEISTLSEKKLGQIRAAQIGFIFQNFNLIPVLTALENVELALRLAGNNDKSDRMRGSQAALESVGLQEFIHRRPRQLSGGQQQRVAIARALVKEPALVIADEPTANLDSENGNQILDLMEKLNQEQGATFLFSTHDHLVMQRARRIIHLKDGRIMEDKHS